MCADSAVSSSGKEAALPLCHVRFCSGWWDREAPPYRNLAATSMSNFKHSTLFCLSLDILREEPPESTRNGIQNLPRYTLTPPTPFSTAHQRLSALSPRQSSGPTFTIPPWIAVLSATWRRYQSIIPHPHARFCRQSRVCDNQQKHEYNMPQTWCAFHRPPPVRDRSICASGRLFCQGAACHRLRSARHERTPKRARPPITAALAASG